MEVHAEVSTDSHCEDHTPTQLLEATTFPIRADDVIRIVDLWTHAAQPAFTILHSAGSIILRRLANQKTTYDILYVTISFWICHVSIYLVFFFSFLFFNQQTSEQNKLFFMIFQIHCLTQTSSTRLLATRSRIGNPTAGLHRYSDYCGYNGRSATNGSVRCLRCGTVDAYLYLSNYTDIST